MEGKFFLGKYLIWVILMLGQLHGYKSCIQKERNALFELKQFIISNTIEGPSDFVLPTWTNDTKSDCCRWEGLKCNRTSGRVTEIVLEFFYRKESTLLNLSLLHPFEEVQSLKYSGHMGMGGFFDDVEGYRSLGRLRNLEILDLSFNYLNNSIFPFLNAATSLTTLFLRKNYLDGPFPAKELKDLTNLELLDLSFNRFNGSIPVQELSALRKLKALDLSSNEFSGPMELQGVCEMKNMQDLDLSRNKLVGQFPLCLTSLSGLRVLDLSSNQLTGNVPSSLGSLESLKYLSLSENNFDGVFSLGSLANLSELRVFKLSSISKSLRVESGSSWKPKFRVLLNYNLATW
uniref:LRR receptor-like serine/threonine-protein kinase RCH1 n=1 Tax=Noccaea caerulescens TaxID=107243 RepID=A0A1J3DET1_NOCCA